MRGVPDKPVVGLLGLAIEGSALFSACANSRSFASPPQQPQLKRLLGTPASLRMTPSEKSFSAARETKIPRASCSLHGESKLLVPKKGLEPPHPCEYMDLNHARLPIPPLRHFATPDVRQMACPGGLHRARPSAGHPVTSGVQQDCNDIGAQRSICAAHRAPPA